MKPLRTLHFFFVVLGLVSISLIEAARKKSADIDSSSDENEFIEAITRKTPLKTTEEALRRSPRVSVASNPVSTQTLAEPKPRIHDPRKPLFTLRDVVPAADDFDLETDLLSFQSRVNGLNESFCAEELDELKTRPVMWANKKGEPEDVDSEDHYEIDENGRRTIKFERLENKNLTMEDHVNPQNNPFSRIMAQYRRDLGFIAVRPFNEEINKEEVFGFMKCLEGTSEAELSRVPYSKLWENYSFLKYLGIIPHYEHLTRFTPEICTEIREATGFATLKEMMDCYEEEFNLYTFLNWEYLDLTHFENQDFKVIDGIIINLKQVGNYGGNGVFTINGRTILSHFADKIRFHNPRTIEGRRMLLFQQLYRLYRKYKTAIMEEMHPSFIDWSGCVVNLWPVGMDRNDLTKWTFEQIIELEELIRSDAIFFVPSSSTSGDGLLGWVPGFNYKEVISVESAKFSRKNECSLSDDEQVCGNGSFRKKYKRLEQKYGKLKPEYNSETKAFVKNLKNERRKKKTSSLEVQTSVEATVPDKKKKENSPKLKKLKKPVKSVSSGTSEEKDRNIVYFKNPNFEEPLEFVVDPEDWKKVPRKSTREKILKEIREMYQEDTGLDGEVDWNLAQLLKLEYHELPFDPSLMSVNDVKIADHLIENGAIAFHDLSSPIDRKVHLYERLYKIYLKVADILANPFDIYAEVEKDGVFVTGWPENIPFDWSGWTEEDVEIITGLLDRNEISFELTAEKRAELEEIRRKLGRRQENLMEIVEKSTESPNGSDTSDNSWIVLSRGSGGLISQCAQSEFASPIQTVTQNTPGFANYVNHKAYTNGIAGNKRKGDKKSEAIESGHRDKLVKENDGSRKVSSDLVTTGPYEGNTHVQVNEFSAKLQRYIEETTLYRDRYPVDSRHNRVYSEILRCLGLLRAHTVNPSAAKLPISEIHKFLEIFSFALNSLAEDGSIDDEIFRIYITNATKLRARLAGIVYNRNGRNLAVPKNRIADFESFSFLCESETTWDFHLLEYYLYTPGLEIFKN